MAGNQIGHVTHYFDHLGVAVLALTDVVQVGDWLHILGHTTDFAQQVVTLEIDHAPVHQAGPDQDVALKVAHRVRPHDLLFHITAEEASQIKAELELDRSY